MGQDLSCIALVLAFGAAWLCAGCNGELSPEAARLLQDARQASAAGEYEAAIRHADAFLAAHRKTKATAEVRYLRGAARMRLGEPDAAKADLQQAARAAKSDGVKAAARIALGDLAHESGDEPAEQEHYAAALDLDARPRPDGTARALYRLGVLLQKQGSWTAADERFDRLIHLHAGSELARQAGDRIRSRAWTIRIDRYGSRPEADARARRLREAGRSARVRPALTENRPEFRVLSGRYATYDLAVAAVADVRRDAPGARVSPTR